MLKIFQTRHGNEGNCFAASIASILEHGLCELPDLAPYAGLPADWNQNLLLQNWLKPRGLSFLEVSVTPGLQFTADCFETEHCVFTVRSSDPAVIEKGGTHAVVGHIFSRDGQSIFEVVHDPKGELRSDYEVLAIGWLVAFRPENLFKP